MPLFRKKIAPAQKTIHASNGVAEITPDRVKHWVSQFKQMRRKGIDFAIPYGHHSAALPIDKKDSDAVAFAQSRYNAGFVNDLEQCQDGSLDAILNLPGFKEENGTLVAVAELPDGRKVPTAIKSVSPALGGTWIDADGKEWKDIIGHVAIVPEPAWPDQPGFKMLSKCKGSKFIYLESDETKETGDELIKSEDEGKKDESESESDDLTPEPEETDESKKISSVLQKLTALGLNLPDDTDCDNFFDRLDVALGVLIQQKAKDKAEEEAARQEEEKPNDQQYEAPMPGIMMSALKSNPIVRRLAGAELDRRKADALAKIESLKARGLPVHKATTMTAAVSFIRLSVNRKTGEFDLSDVEREIKSLEEVLPPADKFDLLSKARIATSPADQNGKADESDFVIHKPSGLRMTKSQLADIQKTARS